MVKTRSKPAGKASASKNTADNAIAAKALEADDNPPKLFVLPKSLRPDATVVTLCNPASLAPTRYYHCPTSGIYEFIKIAAPKHEHRSWLFAPKNVNREEKEQGAIVKANGEVVDGQEALLKAKEEDAEKEDGSSLAKGYIAKTPEMFMATPIDPLFLLLPALSPTFESARDEPKLLFKSSDDIFEDLAEKSKHFRQIIRHPATEALFVSRMKAVCDTVKAGDEIMYRLNHDALLKELLSKARRMAERGLPQSMEDKFVTKALETPMMAIARVDELTTTSETSATESESGAATPSTLETQSSRSTADTTDTQDSIASAATSITVPDTAPAAVAATTATPENIVHLLRLHTALSFLLTAYAPKPLSTTLSEALQFPPRPTLPVDFAPLHTHLAHLATLRADLARSQSISQNFSRKRNLEDAEGEAESRAEKKRKKDEEERKAKIGASRGVKNLAKVDTKGMKKMSDFFGKKAPPAKK
jgi:hypothetical protein